MGVSKIVMGAETDRLESKYTLTTPKGVEKLLRDKHHLLSKAYERGESAAIDILVDMERATVLAQLTEKQATTLFLLYELDLEQQDAAKRIGVDDSTLSRNKHAAIKKIARVFKDWDYNLN